MNALIHQKKRYYVSRTLITRCLKVYTSGGQIASKNAISGIVHNLAQTEITAQPWYRVLKTSALSGYDWRKNLW